MSIWYFNAIGLEGARFTRIGGVPERGADSKKFLTKSVWLNNNKLKNIKNLDQLINALLEHPEQLGWLDVSYNQITSLDDSILNFPELKILYLHGNCLSDFQDVLKLRVLKQLKTVTFHGNPIANHPKYRLYVTAMLPQISNLDFSPVTKTEKMVPPPPEILKIIKGDGKKEDEVEKKK